MITEIAPELFNALALFGFYKIESVDKKGSEPEWKKNIEEPIVRVANFTDDEMKHSLLNYTGDLSDFDQFWR